MTIHKFYLPASDDATLTIDLPEELRGEPLKIVVAKEPAQTKDVEISVDDFLRKYTGILTDCDIADFGQKNRLMKSLPNKAVQELVPILQISRKVFQNSGIANRNWKNFWNAESTNERQPCYCLTRILFPISFTMPIGKTSMFRFFTTKRFSLPL